jgi:hypothetical protein
MALTIAPPVKPRNQVKTRRGGKFYWTIHTHPNHVYTLRVKEDSKTALVGFKHVEDALLIGRMIEKHYIIKKEWPGTEGQIILPSVSGNISELNFLFCTKWDFEDLKLECTKNFLNMITIDKIGNTRNGLSFNGDVLSFDAPLEFYMIRLEDLLNI